MVSHLSFFIVDSKDDCPEYDKEFVHSLQQYKCPECRDLKLPIPNEVTFKVFDPKWLLTSEPIWELVIMRIDLIESLGLRDSEEFSFGSIRMSSGESVEGHQTVWSKRNVLIRGEQHSLLGTCELCGRLRYFPKGDQEYVTSKSVLGIDVAIADGPTLLLVSEPVAKRLQDQRILGSWKQLRLYKIKVRDQAVDGLPDDFSRTREPI